MIRHCLFSGLLILATTHVTATPVRQDAQLTTGGAFTGQELVSDINNPAAGALYRRIHNKTRGGSGAISLGAGLEYGNLDDLFKFIDDVSKRMGGNSNGGNNGGNNGGENGGGIIPPDIEINDPELEKLIAELGKEVGYIAGLLGFVGSDGYSLAKLGYAVPILFNQSIFGGTVKAEFKSHTTAAALGYFDNIPFDKNKAKKALEGIWELNPDSPVTDFDLSGGAQLTVDPATGKVHFRLNNDSTLLTKSVQVNEFTFSYSRLGLSNNHGDLYWGITPRLLRVGSSNFATRIGNITDSKALFDQIRDAELRYENGYTADVGLMWSAKRYHVGAHLKNLHEETFSFPTMDTSQYSSATIIRALERSRHFRLERRLSLEAAIHSEDYSWHANMIIDTDPMLDPVANDHQWLHLSGGYKPNSRFIPTIRAGLHKNFAGTERSYGAVGTTIFKYVNIDLALDLTTVELDGNSYPRGINLNIGVNYGF